MMTDRSILRFLKFKIPALWFFGPRIVRIDDDVSEIRIPLTWRTQNHLRVMYLGALCAGADLAAGMGAARHIFGGEERIDLLFKDLHADFLKRADGDVLFRSADGRAVAEAVARTRQTGERVNLPMAVTATVPSKYGDDPVARFTMGLTMKRR
jgi:acyl-coenzyme A thioesterase PaaI-like protein